MGTQFPTKEAVTICFAHVAYRLGERFAKRNTGIRSFEVRSVHDLAAGIGEADVLVASGFWRNEFADRAPKLRFIQSISAGVDQYSKADLAAKGIRLASAQGVNERAVAEHAMALILALFRRLPEARDNQAKRQWRGMISDLARREEEVGGKILLIVGLGRIGQRLARLAKAFDLHVIGTKRDASTGAGSADEVYATGRLAELLPRADIVALTCPLTPETDGLIDAKALAAMKPGARLVNVARGRVVDEAALQAALESGSLGAAGLDCFREEPLRSHSPLWHFPNVLITPHSAGETSLYEDKILDLLMENLERLWRGDSVLRNQIV
jgi:phosphoglycerate dehydrogenase-like enzyme